MILHDIGLFQSFSQVILLTKRTRSTTGCVLLHVIINTEAQSLYPSCLAIFE